MVIGQKSLNDVGRCQFYERPFAKESTWQIQHLRNRTVYQSRVLDGLRVHRAMVVGEGETKTPKVVMRQLWASAWTIFSNRTVALSEPLVVHFLYPVVL